MSAATVELSADPAVVCIVPVSTNQARLENGNGCVSDGATSGAEQSKTSPSKRKKQRRRSRANSNASSGEQSQVVKPKHQQPVQTSSPEASHSEADETNADTPRQPQRKQSNGRRSSRRRRTQSSKSETTIPAVQTLFESQPNVQAGLPQIRPRPISIPPSLLDRRNSFINDEGTKFQGDLRRLASSDNVSRFPSVGRRSFPPRVYNSDPSFNKPGQSNEFVSREIVDYHLRNRQTSERYNSKQIFRQALEKILIQSYPDYAVSLHLVGSTINSVGDNASSVDVCMLARHKIVSPSLPNRRASCISPALSSDGSTVATSQKSAETVPASSANDSVESKPEENKTVATVAADTSTQPKEEPKKSEASPQEKTETGNTEQPKESPNRKKKNKKKNASNASNAPTEKKPEAKEETKASPVKETAPVETSPAKDSAKESPEKKTKPESVEVAAADSNLSSDVSGPTSPGRSNVATFVEGEPLSLESVERLLHSKSFAKDIKMIAARVPIIKFKDAILLLDVTLNLNQDVSVRNSILIRDYAKMDWRFAPLAMVLKQWAKENHINSAVDKSISNYSWTLMVIHYLQVVEPPVLPCLQRMNPQRYDPGQSTDQALSAWRKPPPKWRSANKSNLRTLLRSMLHYYAYGFLYDQDVISVREGRIIKKEVVMASARDLPMQWNSFMGIEEPFSRTNTTRSVHDKEVFDKILELLRMACTAMKGPRTSLFNIIANDLEHPITY